MIRQKREQYVLFLAFLLAMGLFCLPQTAPGQARDTAGISGTVSDPQGAVIPDTTVTVTNVGTGQSREVQTDASGGFVFALLAVGTYTVRVESEGFQRYEQTGVLLQVGENVRVDVGLEVGDVLTTITVEAMGAQVESRSATLQDTVDERRVVELPLDGRNPADLALLAPGVSPVGNNDGDTGGAIAPRGSKRISVNGSRQNNVRYTLDGGDNNDALRDLNTPFPFPDAVQEFNIQTSNMGVEMGGKSGGSVNVVTKAGTNELHGSAFWFVRNTTLNATDFFSHQEDQLKRNQYGATVGFPVIKNKLFAFGGFQKLEIRRASGGSRAQTLSAAERAGNFSVNPDTIFDPLNNQPFPNQTVPSSRFSPAALSVLKQSPLPDADGFTRFGFARPDHGEQYIGRGDYVINDSHSMNVRYFESNQKNPFSSPAGNIHAVRSLGYQDTKNANIGWNYIVSPTLLTTTRFTASHIKSVFDNDFPISINDHGIRNFGPRVGGTSISLRESGVNFSTNNRGTFTRASFEFLHDWTWIKGNHTVTFGTSVSRKHFNNDTFFRSAGRFEFNGRGTTGPGSPGFDRADFMLGLMSRYQQNNGEFEQRRSTPIALYLSDTWKVKPRLTLTLGLRYEPYELFSDTRERVQFFDVNNHINGVGSTQFLLAPLGLYYPQDAAPDGYPCGSVISHAGACPDWNNIAPRFGFAWDPLGDGRTSVRGGYAIFYDAPALNILNDANNVAPFSYSVELFQKGLLLDDPFAGRDEFGRSIRELDRFPVADFASDTPFADPLYTIVAQNQYITPYVQNWNLTLEREVVRDTLVRLAYVGTKATHLKTEYDRNPATYNPNISLSENRDTVNARRAFRGFQEISHWMLGLNSSYHALQASMDKRYSDGFTLSMSYTWSKGLDYVSFNGFGGRDQVPNPFNFFMTRGQSDYTRPHRFTMSYVWDLPSPVASGPGKAILGDWRFSGIVTMMSGRSLDIRSSGNFVPGAGFSRADSVGSGSPVLGGSKGQRIERYFDTSRFAQPAPGTYGTLGRNTFFGPGYGNYDMSLVKTIPLAPLGEGGRFEVRFEAFNLFNSTHLNRPNRSLTNPNFGKITSTDGEPRILQFALKVSF